MEREIANGTNTEHVKERVPDTFIIVRFYKKCSELG
jgi:hypothetical protein